MFLAGHAAESRAGGRLLDDEELAAAFASSTNDELAAAICELHGLITAAEAQLFAFVSAFAERKAFEEDGCRSMGDWLTARLCLSAVSGRRYARVAAALAHLPHLRASFGAGEVSLDQLAPICSIARPENDEALAQQLPAWSAAEAETVARRAKAVPPKDDAEAHARRYLRLSRSGQCMRISGQLAGLDGETVKSALERIAESYGKDPETGTYERYDARMADALTDLAGGNIAADSDPDRADVIIHVEPDVLAGEEDGPVETGSGGEVSADAARRAACDSRVQRWVRNPRTGTMDVGRTTRSIPPHLSRYLRQRDQTCRFPGCTQTRLVAGHHIWHWSKGGPTNRANLCSLCRRHHRLVHEGGWSVEGDAEDTVTFVSPDGRRLSSRRAPLRHEIAQRFFGDHIEPPGEESAPREECARGEESAPSQSAGDRRS